MNAKKRGRPEVDDPRSVNVAIKFSRAENKELLDLSKRYRRTKSDVVRYLVHREHARLEVE